MCYGLLKCLLALRVEESLAGRQEGLGRRHRHTEKETKTKRETQRERQRERQTERERARAFFSILCVGFFSLFNLKGPPYYLLFPFIGQNPLQGLEPMPFPLQISPDFSFPAGPIPAPAATLPTAEAQTEGISPLMTHFLPISYFPLCVLVSDA